LERERGITILAKAASVQWKDTRINIVDTPGHADFGGEVERILKMVYGALVLVDAAEGPLPQTKFVVSKALKVGLKPIVVINKVHRPDARPLAVVNEVFDLFAALDASEQQLDFPILYDSSREGSMAASPNGPKDRGMAPLFDLVIQHVAEPIIEDGPFRMLGTILEANPYLGRIVTGRISSGAVGPNQIVKVLDRNGKLIEEGRVTKVLAFRGLERTGVDEASAGDIVALAGLPEATVSHTICAPEVMIPLPAQPIDPPTLAMTFRINDSPLTGTEGDKVQSRVIRERLLREAEGNVALRISESTEKDAMEVAGRGELQLGILIETMRREGFELSVSRPQVLLEREAVAYALWNLEDRGPMMIEPGCKVYRGMIVGEHTRGNDLDVNVLKGKKLTNIRTHAKDEAVRLIPPMQMTLEKALAYIAEDELVEVTPKAIRLRKKLLDPNERRKDDRRKEAER